MAAQKPPSIELVVMVFIYPEKAQIISRTYIQTDVIDKLNLIGGARGTTVDRCQITDSFSGTHECM